MDFCDEGTKRNPSITKHFKSQKVEALNNLGFVYTRQGKMTLAKNYFEKAYELSKDGFDKALLSYVLNNYAEYYKNIGEQEKWLEYLLRSLKIRQEIKNDKLVASSYNNLSLYYSAKGNINVALDYMYKGLELFEKTKDVRGTATAYNNIGMFYNTLKDYPNAILNYNKALKIREYVTDKRGVAIVQNNLAFVYQMENDLEKALQLYEKTADIFKSLNDLKSYSTIINNVGYVNEKMGNLDVALKSYQEALAVQKSVSDKRGQCSTLKNLGSVYLKKNENELAVTNAKEGLELSKSMGYLEEIKNASEVLFLAMKKTGNHKEALENHELYMKMRDSIMSDENKKATLKKDLQYQFEKKETLIKAEQEKKDLLYAEEMKREQLLYEFEKKKTAIEAENQKIKLKVQEKLRRDSMAYDFNQKEMTTRLNQEKKDILDRTEKRRQRGIIVAVSAGLAFVLLLAGLIFRGYKQKQAANKELAEKNHLIQQQKQEVESQKEHIEEKNKEIIDSINYAKRLQEAISPPEKIWKKYFPNSFVIYLPKDIVAGDFYWLENFTLNTQDELVIFAAADCTGHGVPGAMVSVVCSNALNRAVKEYKLYEPGKILDKVRELVIETFERSESEVKDGMDISLCCWNARTKELLWAGANNPLWIIRNGDLLETAPDKQPIGKYAELKPFTTHKQNLLTGDRIIIFTDGYADQFGGPKGKKFKGKQLKEIVILSSTENIEVQKKRIQAEFVNWKGQLEQLDDVCLIGIQV